MKSLIAVDLPVRRITFCPDHGPISFPVIVQNDSNRMAQFRLEVIAAGADPNSQIDWCQPSPEVSAAIPYGDKTTFKIQIFNTPIPHFTGDIRLTIKVSSPEFPSEVRRDLTLTIEPGENQNLFGIWLLSPVVQVYPCNSVDILVQIRNFSNHPTEVLLRLSGIPDAWLPHHAERRQLLDPQATGEVVFQCQPPAAKQALSQMYPFRVDGFSRDQKTSWAEGNLQVLPIGFIKFAVTPPQQTIPPKWQEWQACSAQFQAAFENVSNLIQIVTFSLKGRDYQRCVCDVPEATELGLAAFSHLPFEITAKRPWIGLAKTIHLEAIAESHSFHAVDIEPVAQSIQIRVLPFIPLWLLLALLSLFIILLTLLLQPPPIGHTDFVNVVRFSSDGLSAVSGSDDCTIRRWMVAGNRLQPEGRLANPPAVTCNDETLQPPGVLTFANQTVFSLEFLPEFNDRIAAGLANGVIQIWDLPTRQRIAELRDSRDQTEDRVFDLAFTKDARTLFSSHGSGKIRIWQRSPSEFFNSEPTQILKLPETEQQFAKYQVRAIALSPDDQQLVSAGSKNTLALWNWHTSPIPRLLLPQASEEDYIWDATFAPDSKTLATSDSQGFITLWDLEKCPINDSPDAAQKPNSLMLSCPWRRWQAVKESNSAVRSIKFNADSNYIVSASDDGKVILWDIEDVRSAAEFSTVTLTGKTLITSLEKISTVDLLDTERDLLVLSGGDDRHVRLKRN
jgi:WD40 repeat protein